MWGNTFGWILSAFVTAVAVVLAVLLWQKGQPTPPTEFSATTAKPLGAITIFASAAGLDGTDPSLNAGKSYRQAADEIKANHQKSDFDAMLKNNSDAIIETARQTKAFDLIVEGSKGGTMDLYKTPLANIQEIVNYDKDIDSLEALTAAGRAMAHIGMLEKTNKNYDDAKRFLKAVEILGYNLYKERVTYLELRDGEDLMGQADVLLTGIAQLEKNDAEYAAMKALTAARIDEFKKRIDPVHQVLGSIGDQTLEDHAGDFFVLAQNPAAERVWRVESALKIGKLIFNATNKADQTRAPKFLKKLAEDKTQDPIVCEAARRAAAITNYDYQSER